MKPFICSVFLVLSVCASITVNADEQSKFVITGELRRVACSDTIDTYPDGSRLLRRTCELNVRTGGAVVRPACWVEACDHGQACTAMRWGSDEEVLLLAECVAAHPGESIRVSGVWEEGEMHVRKVGPS